MRLTLPAIRPPVRRALSTEPARRRFSPPKPPLHRVGRLGRGTAARASLQVLPILLADVFTIGVVTLATAALETWLGHTTLPGVIELLGALVPALVLAFLAGGLYSVTGMNAVVELRQISRINVLILLTALMVTAVAGLPEWRLFFLCETALLLVLLPLSRSLTRGWAARQKWWTQPALIFGPADTVDAVTKSLLARPECGLRPVAAVRLKLPGGPHGPERFDADQGASALLPTIGQYVASRLVRRCGIGYGIVVADGDPAERLRAVAAVSAMNLPHLLVTDTTLGETPTLWADARDCAGVSAMQVRNRLLLTAPRIVKRFTDLAFTLGGATLLLPLLAIVALAIRLDGPGPIFFGHTRIGRNGRKFKAWKFRTMVPNAGEVLAEYLAANPDAAAEWEADHKLKNDPRVTRVGRFLRASSLDELPQLWNVVTGEMSLVGPRPIVDDEVCRYGRVMEQYTRVRPGITGLWQVSGRNDVTYGERVELDSYYVRNWSPWLDLNLLVRTIKIVVARNGAY